MNDWLTADEIAEMQAIAARIADRLDLEALAEYAALQGLLTDDMPEDKKQSPR